MGNLRQIVGGALAGWGDAVAEQARQQRELMLRQFEADQRMRELSTENQYATQREQSQFAHEDTTQQNQQKFTTAQDQTQHGYRMDEEKQRGLLSQSNAAFEHNLNAKDVVSYTTDANGNTVGLTRSGQVVNTGIQEGDLKKKDKDLLDRLERQFTQKVTAPDPSDPLGETKVTSERMDTKAIANRLIQMGRTDLAQLYGAPPPTKTATPPASPPPVNQPASSTTPIKPAPQADATKQSLDNARAAIQAGADRAKVIARLRAAGIDPSGL